jgi:hypothetical protein
MRRIARRIALVLAAAAVMVAMLVTSALPAVAQAINTKEQCVDTNPADACGHAVLTPSGNLHADADMTVESQSTPSVDEKTPPVETGVADVGSGQVEGSATTPSETIEGNLEVKKGK